MADSTPITAAAGGEKPAGEPASPPRPTTTSSAHSRPTSSSPSAFIPVTGSANFALFPIQTTFDPPPTAEDYTDIPTGATTVDQAAVSASPVHKEGIDHIKSQLDSTTAAPPASNPGADDATGGIAPGAGGVSGAAYKDPANPATTTANKRKSILGTFKGYLGLPDRTKSQQGKETATTSTTTNSDGTYIGAATAAVTGTAAAVAETVQAYTVGTTDDKVATTEGAAKTEDTTTSAAAATEESTADKADKVPAIDGTTSTEEAVKDTEESDRHSIKHDKGAGGTNLVNPDAIPTAGGKKVGEDTWGESQVVPEDPGPPKEETETAGGATVASSAGQPTKEVADNTAANTGSATSGPAGTTSATTDADAPKPKKLLNKIKDKLKKNKN